MYKRSCEVPTEGENCVMLSVLLYQLQQRLPEAVALGQRPRLVYARSAAAVWRARLRVQRSMMFFGEWAKSMNSIMSTS